MKRSKKGRLYKGLAQMLSGLLVITMGGTAIAVQWSSKINDVLGTQSYVFKETEGEAGNTVYFKSDYNTAEELVEAREELITRTMEEGVVLLKNENACLPLTEGKKVTLLGTSSYHSYFSSTTGGASFDESLATHLPEACEAAGLVVNPVMKDFYETLGQEQKEVGVNAWTGEPTMGYVYMNRQDALGEVPMEMYTQTERESYAEYKDAAIVVISRMTGEGSDFSAEPVSAEKGGDGIHNMLQLSDSERKVITEAKDNFDKVIVYVNTDNMIEIEELKQDPEIDAILWSGGVGNVGMYGIANVLAGKTAPSGRLVDTIAVSNANSPAYRNFGAFNFDSDQLSGDNYTHYVVYAENIYVGYKYYNTRYEDMVLGQGNADSTAGSIDGQEWSYGKEVTYGFGEGLSYTTFSQKFDEIAIDKNNLAGEATVTVTNTGNAEGKVPVQIYVQSPYTEYDRLNKVEKAAVQLLGYGKTKVLKPGESETVKVPLNLRNLISYDYANAKTYILDEGTYYFAVGDGAHEALNHILAVKGYTMADGMDAEGNASMTASWENDSFSYAKESESGFEVTNQLDDCDLNYWLPDTVTYLTRSDWEGTWPEPYADIPATDEMVARLNTDLSYDYSYVQDTSITLDGLTTESGTNYNLMMLYDVRNDYDNELWDVLLDQMSFEDYCYCIYTLYPAVVSIGMPSNNNTDSPNGLNASFNTDPTKTYFVDEKTASEKILSYRCNTYPASASRAATFNREIAGEIGRMMGNDGLWTAKGGQTGPGCNIRRTAFSGRNNEYYSEDSVMTSIAAKEEVKQMTEMGLAAAPKHFAFNDQETFRQGLACFFNEQSAREIYLRAFEGPYAEGKPLYGMSSFSRCGLEPATSSKALLTTILRDEWGWKGFTMTDMAHDYMPVAASIIAGTDQWCAFSNEKYLPFLNEEELKKNPELAWACREAAHRVMYMTLNSNAVNGISSNAVVERVLTWWEVALYTVDIVIALLALACLALYIRNGFRKDGIILEEEA